MIIEPKRKRKVTKKKKGVRNPPGQIVTACSSKAFIYTCAAMSACAAMMGIAWLIGYKIGIYNCFCGNI